MNCIDGNKATKPCPCGYLGDAAVDCGCSADKVSSYRRKVSGPILDRVDMQVEVSRPETDMLRGTSVDGDSSAAVRSRVAIAWKIQQRRCGRRNAHLSNNDLNETCDLDDACWALLERAARQFNLSARAHQRIRRVSRTIADLAGVADIATEHVAEALTLRCVDRR